MKPSHLSTPRNLAECQFDVGYPRAYLREQGYRRADAALYVASFIAAVVVAALVLSGR